MLICPPPSNPPFSALCAQGLEFSYRRTKRVSESLPNNAANSSSNISGGSNIFDGCFRCPICRGASLCPGVAARSDAPARGGAAALPTARGERAGGRSQRQERAARPGIAVVVFVVVDVGAVVPAVVVAPSRKAAGFDLDCRSRSCSRRERAQLIL